MSAREDVYWTTRVPPSLDERLAEQAGREDRTKAAVVRRAVERYLDDHQLDQAAAIVDGRKETTR